MTDVTGTTERAEAKPAWTRCNKCKQRLWNDRIDIEVHGQHCPADLERDFKKAVQALEKRIKRLEERPEPVGTELVVAGPLLDFEHEAPWPVDATPVAPEGNGDDDEPPVAPVSPLVAPSSAPAPGRSSWLDDDDDED